MEHPQHSPSHTQAQLSHVELAIKDALSSMPDAGSDAHVQLSAQLGLISSLQASLAAGIPVPESSLQLALIRVQQESLQLAAKKAEQQTIAAVVAEQMMQAEEARLAQEAEAFRGYESAAHERITALGEMSGIDLSVYQQQRDDILAAYEAAIARGDVLGALKQDALLATNNRQGMETVGASEEEMERARKEEEQARERYLRQVELQALRDAQRYGLTGEEQAEYVEAARAKAASELDEERAKLQWPKPTIETEIAVAQSHKAVAAQQEALSKATVLQADTSRAKSAEDVFASGADILADLEMCEADPGAEKSPSSGKGSAPSTDRDCSV